MLIRDFALSSYPRCSNAFASFSIAFVIPLLALPLIGNRRSKASPISQGVFSPFLAMASRSGFTSSIFISITHTPMGVCSKRVIFQGVAGFECFTLHTFAAAQRRYSDTRGGYVLRSRAARLVEAGHRIGAGMPRLSLGRHKASGSAWQPAQRAKCAQCRWLAQATKGLLA